MLRSFCILILTVCFGCTRAQPSKPSSQIDKNRAIEIACQTLSTNAGFQRDKNSFDVSQDGSNWSVTVWSEPKVPGGFCTIVIANDGKVQHIYPGE
jgi:hypothetical protein